MQIRLNTTSQQYGQGETLYGYFSLFVHTYIPILWHRILKTKFTRIPITLKMQTSPFQTSEIMLVCFFFFCQRGIFLLRNYKGDQNLPFLKCSTTLAAKLQSTGPIISRKGIFMPEQASNYISLLGLMDICVLMKIPFCQSHKICNFFSSKAKQLLL